MLETLSSQCVRQTLVSDCSFVSALAIRYPLRVPPARQCKERRIDGPNAVQRGL